MLSEMGRRPIIRNNDGSFGDELEELGLMRRDQRRQETDDLEKELNLYRSGSAPPTVEGSLNAVGGLFGHGGGDNAFSGFSGHGKNINEFVSEDDVRSDPAYLSYYYSKVNMNPRLPPPLLTKEDWRSAQRLKGSSSTLGGIGDRRKVNLRPENGGDGGGRSLFSMPPGFNSPIEEGEVEQQNLNVSPEWGGNGLIGFSGLGIGSNQTSLADIFQNDMGRATPVSSHPSRPVSRNAFDENVENLGSSVVQSMGPPASYSYAAVVGGSISRSTTPDPQLIARAPSPSITPIGRDRNLISEKRGVNSPGLYNGIPPNLNESPDLVAAFSGMSLSTNKLSDEKHIPSQIEQEVNNMQNTLFNLKQQSYLKKSESAKLHMPYSDSSNNNGGWSDHNNSSMMADMQFELNKSGSSYLKGSSTSKLNGGSASSSHYQHADNLKSSYQNYGLNEYGMNPVADMMASQLGKGTMPPLFENVAAASAMNAAGIHSRMLGGGLTSDSYHLNRMGNQLGNNALQSPFLDPTYLQYLRTADYAAAQAAAFNEPPQTDLGLQKAYLGNLLSTQKSQYGGNSTLFNQQGYYMNPAYGVGMPYPGSPLASPIIPNSLVRPGSPMRPNELGMSFPSGIRNLAGGLGGPWHLDAGYGMNDSFSSSLLEEFKGNKTKCFELSEIAGHVVEFSADQYGSRFIQQKLETATTEEKNMVYQEIFPQALSLMTDVFGNYVIQKFFEHGMPNQRRELACKLYGHVLTLSLQMYGCRVIQKAIEVVDLDQKIKMVEELDGHIMRCVRDQNGNHVIQKCIECVPEEAIQFIVSTFFNQVVILSTHPYGCRVIQRVLEHCEDPDTQNKVMVEVLGSVSMLAQDQYGNYVVQHVLEHGKPDERSFIIKELAGKIVQMSQQKFASNVVEKCLTFGGPAERQLLVIEMLGTTDENEPLQAMMKDQFANYVVQKVLETCDDQQRELILTRIKIHLNALKKYTYGKHIVARVEKLVAAGERRTASQNQHPA